MAESNEQHLENLPLISTQILKDFTAGILANCLGTFIGHPLDTVKVRMQLSTVNPPVYTLIKRIIHNEGISGLFKGVASPLIGQAPISASAFMANDFAKRALKRVEMSKNQTNFVAGWFTGFVSTVFTTPIEYIKIKKQGHQGENLTYFKILKEEGLRRTFKGFSSTVMRDVPGWCAYFFAYDFLKHQLENYITIEDNKKKTFLCQSIAGGFAGQISWIVCYPADWVKSYIQFHPENKTIIDTTLSLYRRHGFNYFFKGLSPCLMRAFPINSVVFVAYEYFLNLLNTSPLSD